LDLGVGWLLEELELLLDELELETEFDGDAKRVSRDLDLVIFPFG
jgi:hypothetical protein